MTFSEILAKVKYKHPTNPVSIVKYSLSKVPKSKRDDIEDALKEIYDTSVGKTLLTDIIEANGKLIFGRSKEGSRVLDLDIKTVYVDFSDTAKSYLTLGGGVAETTLAQILFHELTHVAGTKSRIEKKYNEVQLKTFYEEPDFDHMGGSVRQTNEFRAEQGDVGRGSYLYMLDPASDFGILILPYLQSLGPDIAGSYDQAVLFWPTLDGQHKFDSVGTLVNGEASNDLVVGLNDSNLIRTGKGDDTLVGNGGKDILWAGRGKDTLYDGAGEDAMYGGRGRDTFYLVNDGERDVIRDFQLGVDKIVLAGTALDDIAADTIRFKDVRDGVVKVKYGSDVLILIDGKAGKLTADDFTKDTPGPEAEVPALQDVTLSSFYHEETNYGYDTDVVLVGGWGDYYHALFQFDLADAPTDSDRAVIRLEARSLSSGWSYTDMALYRVDSGWTETAGYYDRPEATFIRNLDGPKSAGKYEIDITDLFSDWMSGTEENFGIELRPLANNASSNYFHSSEATLPDLRPVLYFETDDVL